jgi:hypothetical protein
MLLYHYTQALHMHSVSGVDHSLDLDLGGLSFDLDILVAVALVVGTLEVAYFSDFHLMVVRSPQEVDLVFDCLQMVAHSHLYLVHPGPCRQQVFLVLEVEPRFPWSAFSGGCPALQSQKFSSLRQGMLEMGCHKTQYPETLAGSSAVSVAAEEAVSL